MSVILLMFILCIKYIFLTVYIHLLVGFGSVVIYMLSAYHHLIDGCTVVENINYIICLALIIY